MKQVNAISATVFFALAGIIMALYGTHYVQALVVMAFILGAISQFLMQDWRQTFQNIASGCAYGAIGLVVIAGVAFALQI